MQTLPLSTEARKDGVASKEVRTDDRVPCVVYGNDVDHTVFTCDYSELYRVYAKAGESVVVDLDLAGSTVPALFHEVQFAPVSDKIIHVDFYALDMKKEIEAQIPIEFTGESAAINGGGIFVTVNDTLNVKCLPTALPQHLEASLEPLKEFGDSLLVSAISVPAGVTVLDEPETMIATVQEPRAAEPEPTTEVAEGEEGGEEKAEGGEDKKEGGEEKSE